MNRIIFKKFRGLILFLAALWLASCSPGAATVVVDPGLPARAAEAAQNALATELGVEVGSIQIVETQAVEWADACLEIQIEGVSCAQVITPGFKVVLEVNGQTYEVRTNEDATNVQLVPNP